MKYFSCQPDTHNAFGSLTNCTLSYFTVQRTLYHPLLPKGVVPSPSSHMAGEAEGRTHYDSSAGGATSPSLPLNAPTTDSTKVCVQAAVVLPDCFHAQSSCFSMANKSESGVDMAFVGTSSGLLALVMMRERTLIYASGKDPQGVRDTLQRQRLQFLRTGRSGGTPAPAVVAGSSNSMLVSPGEGDASAEQLDHEAGTNSPHQYPASHQRQQQRTSSGDGAFRPEVPSTITWMRDKPLVFVGYSTGKVEWYQISLLGSRQQQQQTQNSYGAMLTSTSAATAVGASGGGSPSGAQRAAAAAAATSEESDGVAASSGPFTHTIKTQGVQKVSRVFLDGKGDGFAAVELVASCVMPDSGALMTSDYFPYNGCVVVGGERAVMVFTTDSMEAPLCRFFSFGCSFLYCHPFLPIVGTLSSSWDAESPDGQEASYWGGSNPHTFNGGCLLNILEYSEVPPEQEGAWTGVAPRDQHVVDSGAAASSAGLDATVSVHSLPPPPPQGSRGIIGVLRHAQRRFFPAAAPRYGMYYSFSWKFSFNLELVLCNAEEGTVYVLGLARKEGSRGGGVSIDGAQEDKDREAQFPLVFVHSHRLRLPLHSLVNVEYVSAATSTLDAAFKKKDPISLSSGAAGAMWSERVFPSGGAPRATAAAEGPFASGGSLFIPTSSSGGQLATHSSTTAFQYSATTTIGMQGRGRRGYSDSSITAAAAATAVAAAAASRILKENTLAAQLLQPRVLRRKKKRNGICGADQSHLRSRHHRSSSQHEGRHRRRHGRSHRHGSHHRSRSAVKSGDQNGAVLPHNTQSISNNNNVSNTKGGTVMRGFIEDQDLCRVLRIGPGVFSSIVGMNYAGEIVSVPVEREALATWHEEGSVFISLGAAVCAADIVTIQGIDCLMKRRLDHGFGLSAETNMKALKAVGKEEQLNWRLMFAHVAILEKAGVIGPTGPVPSVADLLQMRSPPSIAQLQELGCLPAFGPEEVVVLRSNEFESDSRRALLLHVLNWLPRVSARRENDRSGSNGVNSHHKDSAAAEAGGGGEAAPHSSSESERSYEVKHYDSATSLERAVAVETLHNRYAQAAALLRRHSHTRPTYSSMASFFENHTETAVAIRGSGTQVRKIFLTSLGPWLQVAFVHLCAFPGYQRSIYCAKHLPLWDRVAIATILEPDTTALVSLLTNELVHECGPEQALLLAEGISQRTYTHMQEIVDGTGDFQLAACLYARVGVLPSDGDAMAVSSRFMTASPLTQKTPGGGSGINGVQTTSSGPVTAPHTNAHSGIASEHGESKKGGTAHDEGDDQRGGGPLTLLPLLTQQSLMMRSIPGLSARSVAASAAVVALVSGSMLPPPSPSPTSSVPSILCTSVVASPTLNTKTSVPSFPVSCGRSAMDIAESREKYASGGSAGGGLGGVGASVAVTMASGGVMAEEDEEDVSPWMMWVDAYHCFLDQEQAFVERTLFEVACQRLREDAASAVTAWGYASSAAAMPPSRSTSGLVPRAGSHFSGLASCSDPLLPPQHQLVQQQQQAATAARLMRGRFTDYDGGVFDLGIARYRSFPRVLPSSPAGMAPSSVLMPAVNVSGDLCLLSDNTGGGGVTGSHYPRSQQNQQQQCVCNEVHALTSQPLRMLLNAMSPEQPHCSVCQCTVPQCPEPGPGMLTWCTACLHGGHVKHLQEWFMTHRKCPVNGCLCHCDEDVNLF